MVKKVGDYELESKIGEGNYGVVYLGKNSKTQGVVASKAIPMKNPNPKLLKQMDTEIRVLKSSECPYIIKLHDVLKTQNNIYLIMEYCGGGDMENYVKVNGRVQEPIAQRWLSQLVESFIYLQEKGIMHRDIKLANILLTTNDDQNADIRVADFGFARFLNENSFAATQLGTPLFMAPEIFNNEHYSYKADVWSLGVLSYEILTGTSVFTCRTLAQLKKMQQEEIKFPEYMSNDAKSLINSMLTYDHANRPSFQQLRGHAFFRSIYNLQEIPADSIAASPEIQMEDDYELCEHDSPEELVEEKVEDGVEEVKDDTPLVKMEPKFADLASRTMEIDSQVEHVGDLVKFGATLKKKILGDAIALFCGEKILMVFNQAEKVAAEFSLTRSKDLMFSELYEKIQSMLITSNETTEKIKPVNDKKLFKAVELEVKNPNNDMKTIKNKLWLMEVVIEKSNCPEELKECQSELIKLHKDLIRRNYY